MGYLVIFSAILPMMLISIYSIRSVLSQIALVQGFRRRDAGSPLREDPPEQG